jgi:Fic family protein
MAPPYEITKNMLSFISEISLLIGKYEGLISPLPTPKLRKQNKIKTIHGTLSIEGNTLNLKQITAILDNKKVIGHPKEILEVNNAISVYSNLNKFKKNSLKSFLRAHKLLMNDLDENAGKFRIGNVGILKGDKVYHVAPKASLVSELMSKLFNYLKKSKDQEIIKSCVFHYELEFIHPFRDGNGRIGRFWQTILLYNYHPVFEYVPVESLIKENQKSYYNVLEKSDSMGESTLFIEFMLKIIYKSLLVFFESFKPETITIEDRIKKAKAYFKERVFSRKDYISYFKNISSATASRDLRDAVKNKILLREGTKRLTKYKFL